MKITDIFHEDARANYNDNFLDWYGTEYSKGDVDEIAGLLAEKLKQCGVKRGDRVCIYLGNCPEYLIIHLAILYAGAVICPISPVYKKIEIEYQIDDIIPVFIFCGSDLRENIESIDVNCTFDVVEVNVAASPGELSFGSKFNKNKGNISSTRSLYEKYINSTFKGTKHFNDSNLNLSLFYDDGVSDEDVYLIAYTSGTTGMPKGAMLTHKSAYIKTKEYLNAAKLSINDILLPIAPLYHMAGIFMGINVPLLLGARFGILKKFDVDLLHESILRLKPTWMFSMAPMNRALLDKFGSGLEKYVSLKVNPCVSFGVSLTEDLANEWKKRLAPSCICFEAGYGLTESHSMDATANADNIKWGSVGRVSRSVEIKIVDPSTYKEVERGTVGEILIKGEGNFKGYWQKPKETNDSYINGWLKTGDLGALDNENYLFFKGRLKELIKCNGYSIFPDEIEYIIQKYKGIRAVVVRGESDDQRGEVPVAYLVIEEGGEFNTEMFVRWCKENMAPYKVPADVRLRQSFPTTGSGKVLRRLVK